MSRPTYRIRAKSKKKGKDGKHTYHDIGAAWPPKEDGFPLGITLGSNSQKFPMSLDEVGRIVTSGDFFFDLVPIEGDRAGGYRESGSEAEFE